MRLPGPAVDALIEALAAVAEGRDVMVVPADRDLTTGQAAEVLGVSRQYLVRLLDDEVIPPYFGRLPPAIPTRRPSEVQGAAEREALGSRREMVREPEAAGLYD